MTGPTKRHDEVVLASAARSVNANAEFSPWRSATRAALYLDVTGATGTGITLDVKVDVKDPAGGGWVEVAAFTQVVAVIAAPLRLVLAGPLAGKMRVRWVIAGTTPIFTFSVGATYQEA